MVPRTRFTSGRPGGWWRRQRLQRLAVRCGAVVLVVASMLAVRGAADERERWGTSTEVIVAQRSLDRGHLLTQDDLTKLALPTGAVPVGAVAAGDEAELVGRMLDGPVGTREVISSARVTPEALSGLARLVPEGARAVSVPLDEMTSAVLGLAEGMHLDLVRIADPFDQQWGGTATPTALLAGDVEVLAVDARAVVVLVPADDADEIAGAAAAGHVVVVLRGA